MQAARDEGWRTTGADLSHQACAIVAAAGPVVQADARALPFAGATFDALTLVNVLDHTINPLLVVREAARVLRPGGLLVVRIPNAAFHAPWARRCSPTSGRCCAGAAGTRTRFSTSSRCRPARCAAWSSAPGSTW